MSTFLTILLIILAFFGGMLAGMYLLRKQFEKNLHQPTFECGSGSYIIGS